MVSGVGQPAPFGMLVLAESIRPTLKDPAVRAEMTKELAGLLRHVNAELAEYEKLAMLVVASQPWSIENGFLTPTMKIKRSRIEKANEPHIEAWYANTSPVIWA
jgi:long-subunit acyl-CoA synthetase (AMP-forming)